MCALGSGCDRQLCPVKEIFAGGISFGLCQAIFHQSRPPKYDNPNIWRLLTIFLKRWQNWLSWGSWSFHRPSASPGIPSSLSDRKIIPLCKSIPSSLSKKNLSKPLSKCIPPLDVVCMKSTTLIFTSCTVCDLLFGKYPLCIARVWPWPKIAWARMHKQIKWHLITIPLTRTTDYDVWNIVLSKN